MIGITSSIQTDNPTQSYSLIPLLSSADNGTIYVDSSSNYDSTYTAWRAFDGVKEHDLCYHNKSPYSYPVWLAWHHRTKQSKINQIRIYKRPIQPNCVPGNWSLQGSNDNINWDVLQSYTNGSGDFAVDVNPYNQWYYNYRIFINASAGGDHIAFCEIEFWGYYKS